MGTVREGQHTYISHLTQFFLERGMLHTNLYKKQNTHFVFNNVFFENRAVYVIICKNFESQAGRRLQPGAWALRAGYLQHKYKLRM